MIEEYTVFQDEELGILIEVGQRWHSNLSTFAVVEIILITAGRVIFIDPYRDHFFVNIEDFVKNFTYLPNQDAPKETK